MTTTPSLSREDVAELRREAEHWAQATHTVTGPAIAKMLRSAANEIERLHIALVASQSLDREPNPDLAAAIEKELRGRGYLANQFPAWKSTNEVVCAALDNVISAVLSVVAQREAEIRRAVIEECAKVAEGNTWWPLAEHFRISVAIAETLRAVAQQPAKATTNQ